MGWILLGAGCLLMVALYFGSNLIKLLPTGWFKTAAQKVDLYGDNVTGSASLWAIRKTFADRGQTANVDAASKLLAELWAYIPPAEVVAASTATVVTTTGEKVEVPTTPAA